MKSSAVIVYLVFLMPVVLFVNACDKKPPATAQAAVETKWIYIGENVKATAITWGGHDYLIVTRIELYSGGVSMLHAASCHCQTNAVQKIER